MSRTPGLLLRFKTLLGLRPVRDRARRFTEDAGQYRDRVAAQRLRLRGPDGGRRVAFLVTPWMRTAVPFSLETAFLAAARGLRPVILWDAENVVHNAESAHEVEAVRAIVDLVRGVAEVCEPGAEDGSGAASGGALVRELRAWQPRGAAGSRAPSRRNRKRARLFHRHYRRVFRLLAETRPDHLISPRRTLGALRTLSGRRRAPRYSRDDLRLGDGPARPRSQRHHGAF